jgi:hypothetical protein
MENLGCKGRKEETPSDLSEAPLAYKNIDE